MNKLNIDAVIVVEGKEDVCYLSSFLKAYFFTTNGFDINEEKLEFLSRVSKNKKVIILTDPDEAGKKIREKIVARINDVFVVEIVKNSRKNYIKSGVAESEKQVIIDALKPFIIEEEIKIENYDLSTLISLDNNPSDKKLEIIEKYRLINGNNKFLENQLNMLGIKPEEIR